MFVTVDERDARPLYQQLVDEIKTLIARGELEEGTLLPPVRQVASDLGVNLNTVAFAYRRLQKEGLICVRHGSGAVVISQTLKEKPDDRLRAQLRTALTQLILAGLKQPEIKVLINEELDELLREPRRRREENIWGVYLHLSSLHRQKTPPDQSRQTPFPRYCRKHDPDTR